MNAGRVDHLGTTGRPVLPSAADQEVGSRRELLGILRRIAVNLETAEVLEHRAERSTSPALAVGCSASAPHSVDGPPVGSARVWTGRRRSPAAPSGRAPVSRRPEAGQRPASVVTTVARPVIMTRISVSRRKSSTGSREP